MPAAPPEIKATAARKCGRRAVWSRHCCRIPPPPRLTTASDPFAVEYPTVENSELTVTGLTPGVYSVELWDPQTRTILEIQEALADDGRTTVALSSFRADLVLKVKRV